MHGIGLVPLAFHVLKFDRRRGPREITQSVYVDLCPLSDPSCLSLGETEWRSTPNFFDRRTLIAQLLKAANERHQRIAVRVPGSVLLDNLSHSSRVR